MDGGEQQIIESSRGALRSHHPEIEAQEIKEFRLLLGKSYLTLFC